MANSKNEWDATLKMANADLAAYEREIRVMTDEEGFYDVDIITWNKDGSHETEAFAENYYEHELEVCINEAWAKARADVAEKAKAADKVWLVTQESKVDGEITFNVIPCKDLGTAILEMKKEIDTILDESPKYKDARRWMEGDDTLNYDECPFVWENENHDSWYLEVINDDYYENLRIEEKEII